jgi:hypothetical protein
MNWERICDIAAADSLKNDSYLGIFMSNNKNLPALVDQPSELQ